MEKQRRWALRRQRSFVEDTRDGLQREGAGSAQPEMRGMCRVARLPSHLANISVIYLGRRRPYPDAQTPSTSMI